MKLLRYAAPLLFLAPSAAFASCLQSDLAGTWRVFTGNTGYNYASACTLVFGSAGAVNVSRSSCKDSEGFDNPVVGGKFKVTSTCAVTGTLTTQLGGIDTVPAAQMNIGKDTLSGIGLADDDTAFVFNAIKR